MQSYKTPIISELINIFVLKNISNFKIFYLLFQKILNFVL